MFIRLFANALSDISAGMKRLPLVATLGWQDVRQRYRRSMLGPFWLTISMGVMIGTIGLVLDRFSKHPPRNICRSSPSDLSWGFISTALTEGCTNFIQADAIIKQLPIPLIVHVLRPIWRNVIILAHNFAIFPIVLFVMDRPVTETIWLALPGFLLLLLNLTWLSTALGVVCARYRDIPQIIASLMQVVFYLTPIMWLPNLLPERAGMYMLTFNPFFHLIEIVPRFAGPTSQHPELAGSMRPGRIRLDSDSRPLWAVPSSYRLLALTLTHCSYRNPWLQSNSTVSVSTFPSTARVPGPSRSVFFRLRRAGRSVRTRMAASPCERWKICPSTSGWRPHRSAWS